MKLLLLIAAVTGAALIWGPGSGIRFQNLKGNAGKTPDLDIRKAMAGRLISEGLIYGPTGKVSSRFVAEMNGTWDGPNGVITEHFRYDTGNRQDREWRLTIDDSGRITGSAPDIVGTVEGRQSGASARLNYRIRLPEEAGGHVLSVTDWLFLMENGTLMNRSQMRKFGITVAELVATIRPADDAGR